MTAAVKPARAAVIGGGVIGGGWVARLIQNGVDVGIYDPDPEASRKIDAVMTNADAALGKLTMAPLPRRGEMRFAGSVAEAVAGAELIVEAVPERLDIKQAVYAEIEAAAATDAPSVPSARTFLVPTIAGPTYGLSFAESAARSSIRRTSRSSALLSAPARGPSWEARAPRQTKKGRAATTISVVPIASSRTAWAARSASISDVVVVFSPLRPRSWAPRTSPRSTSTRPHSRLPHRMCWRRRYLWI